MHLTALKTALLGFRKQAIQKRNTRANSKSFGNCAFWLKCQKNLGYKLYFWFKCYVIYTGLFISKGLIVFQCLLNLPTQKFTSRREQHWSQKTNIDNDVLSVLNVIYKKLIFGGGGFQTKFFGKNTVCFNMLNLGKELNNALVLGWLQKRI